MKGGDNMKIDWKQKLSSRKLWTAVASFITLIMIYNGSSEGTAESVASIIMAGGTIIIYMLSEAATDVSNKTESED